jgi:hypothetical protein
VGAIVKSGKERTIYWDESLPSFGLRVTKPGRKCFIVQYRAGRGRSGKDRRLTIGSGIALELARREAKKLRGQGRGARSAAPRDEAQRATRPVRSGLFARATWNAKVAWSVMTMAQ